MVSMNIGPTAHASFLEIFLGAAFVLIAFAVLLFAFATPLVAFFSMHKERWSDYSAWRKLKILGTISLVAGVSILLIWLSTGTNSEY